MSETFTVNGLTVKIEQEEDAQSPQENEDTGLFLVAKHRDFTVPAPGMNTVPEHRNEIEDMFKDTHWIFPLEAYIHSGVVLALSGERNFPDRQWDVSQLGMVFVAKSEWRLSKSARKAALSLVEEWNMYLSGDVWCFSIEDSEGDLLESCGGMYGLEYAKKEATMCAKHYGKKSVKNIMTKREKNKMNKEQALKLIGAVAKTAVRSYQIVNGDRRGKAEKAVKDEYRAARALLAALNVGEIVTDSEIDDAVGN